MAVPALPATQSTGGTATASYANTIRDGLAWFRDDRPTLVVSSNPSQSITSATTTIVQFSNGSSTWYSTPSVNVDGWLPSGSDGDVIVPETGLYLITCAAQFNAGGTGYRQVNLWDTGSLIGGSTSNVNSVGAAGTTNVQTTAYGYFTAGDELGAKVYHNQGSALTVVCSLAAQWVGSSTS